MIKFIVINENIYDKIDYTENENLPRTENLKIKESDESIGSCSLSAIPEIQVIKKRTVYLKTMLIGIIKKKFYDTS